MANQLRNPRLEAANEQYERVYAFFAANGMSRSTFKEYSKIDESGMITIKAPDNKEVSFQIALKIKEKFIEFIDRDRKQAGELAKAILNALHK